MPDELPAPVEGQALIYATADGTVRVEVLFQRRDVLAVPDSRIAELFGVDVRTVSEHLKEHLRVRRAHSRSQLSGNSGEFNGRASRDVSRWIDFYNLDAIISVGYRVNSRQATQFRIWATQTLREFIVKGFVLDDERLKQGARFGKDYFDELLERIREIRASERRFYLKITDIYEQCSIDYDEDAEITQTFFATVQNKLHWAITRHDRRRDRRRRGQTRPSRTWA